MTSAKPDIQVENICVDFSLHTSLTKSVKIRAVNNVNFAIHKGEALALVGESGSGKSTCARAISKLHAISAGSVYFQGENIQKHAGLRARKAYAKKVQMIFQDPFSSLNPVHSVHHHIARPLSLHTDIGNAKALHENVCHLLEQVGLIPAQETAKKYPHELSGGQKQRVAIARALAVGAEIILADEPISMLDVSIRLGILNLMEDMKQQYAIGFLYITHDIATANYFAERIAVLYVGHIVEWGTSTSVTTTPQHPYTQLLISSVPNPKRRLMSATQHRSVHMQPSGHDIPMWTPHKKGCPFASRCPVVQPVCNEQFPNSKRVADDHYVCCHAI